MTKWFNTYDEAYCFLMEAGCRIDYDPEVKRTRYPDCCIDKGTGASAGRYIASY